MKLHLCIAAVAVLLLAGCKSEKQRLNEQFAQSIESLEKQLPMRVAMGTLDAVDYADSKATVVCTLTPPYDKIVKASEAVVSPKLMAANFVAPFKTDVGLTTEQIRTMGLNYEVIYRDGNGTRVRSIAITNEELCEVSDRIDGKNADEPLYSKEFYLDYIYASNKPLLPMELDEYTTFTDIDTSHGTVDYIYTLSTLPVEITDKVEAEIRKTIVASLKEAYRSTPIILHDWELLGLVLNYYYYDTSGEKILELSIEAKEINNSIR